MRLIGTLICNLNQLTIGNNSKREFLNWFYNTRRTVSMMELTNTQLWKDEPVVDYINRWRSLSLDCKDKLTEISAMEMCIQGMHLGLLYILQGIKPRIFKELANWVHDMELSISSHGNTKPLIPEERKERQEIRKNDRNAKSNIKDLMNINSALSMLGLDPWRRKRKPPPS